MGELVQVVVLLGFHLDELVVESWALVGSWSWGPQTRRFDKREATLRMSTLLVFTGFNPLIVFDWVFCALKIVSDFYGFRTEFHSRTLKLLLFIPPQSLPHLCVIKIVLHYSAHLNAIHSIDSFRHLGILDGNLPVGLLSTDACLKSNPPFLDLLHKMSEGIPNLMHLTAQLGAMSFANVMCLSIAVMNHQKYNGSDTQGVLQLFQLLFHSADAVLGPAVGLAQLQQQPREGVKHSFLEGLLPQNVVVEPGDVDPEDTYGLFVLGVELGLQGGHSVLEGDYHVSLLRELL